MTTTYKIPTMSSPVSERLIHDAGILWHADMLFPQVKFHHNTLMGRHEYEANPDQLQATCDAMSLICASRIGTPGSTVWFPGGCMETSFAALYGESTDWIKSVFSSPTRDGFRGVARRMVMKAETLMGVAPEGNVVFRVQPLSTYLALIADTRSREVVGRKIYPGAIEVKEDFENITVEKTIRVQVLSFTENERDYTVYCGSYKEVEAFCEYATEQVDHVDSDEYNDKAGENTVAIHHGCRRFSSFEEAFRHYSPSRYNSDGHLCSIREGYRQMQWKALKLGWVKTAAPNTYEEI